MKLSIKDFLRIWSHLLTKSLMENFIFCPVFETKLSERSLITIKKKIGPRIDSWGTPALTLAQEEYWPFRTTLCFLASRKSILLNSISYLLLTPFCFNLKMSQLSQTLSNAFDLSRKTPLASYPSSKDL